MQVQTTQPYLIWSYYHNCWFRPAAAGYTDHISAAGVFTDREIDPDREVKVYFAEVQLRIISRRAALIREFTLLSTVEEMLLGVDLDPEKQRLTAKRTVADISAMSINELELSVRSIHCLFNADIMTIGDLVSRTNVDLLNLPYFGRKSLNEVREVLDSLGLKLREKERT